VRLPQAHVKDRWQDDVCLQSTPSTCGPCAAATVLRALGDDVTESELAEAARATTSGTLNWLLVRALRARGHTARFRDAATIDEVAPPAIIGVWIGGHGGIGHFLAYLGKDAAGAYVIGEPLKGRRVLSAGDMARAYRFDAFAIEVVRQE
jgi:ABC-type bacteriocin/lantibiotic exporter with double-glycine peptidase domain